MLPREISSKGWPTRRAQRCLIFAVVFGLILIFGLSWPKRAHLKVHEFHGLYTYNSKPEHGMPNLPFADSSKRRSSGQPFFEWPDESDPADPPPSQLVGMS